jgi:hypothetical protein
MATTVILRALAEPRERVLTAALQYMVAVRDLENFRTPVADVNDAEMALAFMCRNLVRAVDALPMEQRPRGWGDS